MRALSLSLSLPHLPQEACMESMLPRKPSVIACLIFAVPIPDRCFASACISVVQRGAPAATSSGVIVELM